MTREPIIELADVTFGYGSTPVLTDVSLRVDPGEYLAVVGPNGSGKSTLLELALGLRDPDEGRTDLFGRPASAFEDGDRVGYVAQQSEAATKMPITVREVVRMGRYASAGFGRLTAEDRRAVTTAIETVGMTAYTDRQIGALSGGQRQRAFIARALAGEAELLVLDEPTVGVDAESVSSFYDLLTELNNAGVTIVIVEHDLRAVTDHVNRVVCLNRELYFDGPTEEFLDSDALPRAFGTAVGVTGESA
jgi:zinc transport system ATP-binding protein